MGKNTEHIQHVKSNVVLEGKPKLPQPSALVDGELAINYASGVETISIKNSSGDIVTFSSDNYYTQQKLGSGFTGENSANTVTSVIEENEIVTSAALNDLKENKLDVSAYTPSVELWVSGTGENAIAQKGGGNTASGKLSVAMGSGTTASGDYSVAEGNGAIASGYFSHAEGLSTTANGSASHAEGNGTIASGFSSHAEGYYTTASGDYGSHAEGYYTQTSNSSEHASGQYNVSSSASTTFGNSGNTLFSVGNGYYDNTEHAEVRHNAFEIRQNGDIYISSGNSDIKLQDYIGVGGTVEQVLDDTTSASTNAISAGAVYSAITDNEFVWANAYAVLSGTVSAHTANTEIHVTAADKERWDSGSTSLWVSGTGQNAVAQKNGSNTASGDYSVAEGYQTNATSYYTHAEGYMASANTYIAHAEGSRTLASGSSSHAEGSSTIAGGNQSHAEGSSTKAKGESSHAEGQYTTASGVSSHAEGNQTVAGNNSHAEGFSTSATSDSSHAEGNNTETKNFAEHASGAYNVSSSASTTFGHSGNTLFSVGNGTYGNNARHNAFEIRQNGDIYITSGGTASSESIKLQDSIESKADKSDLGGLKLVKVTQAEYDALTTKDPNTLYVIVN